MLLDVSENFFKQQEIHLLKKTFKSHSHLYFELGYRDHFQRFEMPNRFFFEKIKGLLNIQPKHFVGYDDNNNDNNNNNENNMKDGNKAFHFSLDTRNRCYIRVTKAIIDIDDEDKQLAKHHMPFCTILFIESCLSESKKSIYRIILKFDNISEYELHQVILLIGDFFNLALS